MSNTLKITLKKGKTTKNKVVYEDKENAVLTAAYVDKTAFDQPYPETVRITIERVGSDGKTDSER